MCDRTGKQEGEGGTRKVAHGGQTLEDVGEESLALRVAVSGASPREEGRGGED